MVTCPTCQIAGPTEGGVCARCGQHLTAATVAVITRTAPATDPASDTPRPAQHPASTHMGVVPAARPPAPVTPTLDGRLAAQAVTPPPDPPAGPPGLRARLVVLRGERVGVEYPLYDGRNTVGRFVDKPVDIDLIAQEHETQVWCSRAHAAVTVDRGAVAVEDLNSLNGTWVNGARIAPGQARPLRPNDVVQVGTVQLRLVVG